MNAEVDRTYAGVYVDCGSQLCYYMKLISRRISRLFNVPVVAFYHSYEKDFLASGSL